MDSPERIFRTLDREGTEELAEALGRCIDRPLTVALSGELGSGKTTFVRGLARGLEVVDPVSSPTFTLLQEYAGRLPLWHFDAWMQEREEAFLESGAAELMDGQAVVVVEWAERIAPWLPPVRMDVKLEPVGPQDPGGEAGERRITMRGRSDADQSAAEGLFAWLTDLLGRLEPPPAAREIDPDREPLPGSDVRGGT